MMRSLGLWVLLVAVLFLRPVVVSAQNCVNPDRNSCASLSGEAKVSCYQQAVTSCSTQKETLTSQVTAMDTQMRITTLRIDSTKSTITALLTEIGELAIEVQRLDAILTRRLTLLLHRIPESYKRSVNLGFGTVLLSKDFSDFVTRAKYVTKIQEEDATLVFQVKATQNSYTERKALREKKEAQLQDLRRDLENKNAELTRQKQAKDLLLNETKGQEAVYQKLLAQALAEKAAIDNALTNATKDGPVKRGDPIAIVGNSGFPGCSTGAHLHFEVRKNGQWTDPAGYLSNKTVIDEQNGGSWSVGNGNWDWPLADTVQITQRYGKTPWSWRYTYAGGIHTGYDMVSTTDSMIRAPADGTLYSSSQSCGGSTINIKYIDHGDGVVSFFLHVR